MLSFRAEWKESLAGQGLSLFQFPFQSLNGSPWSLDVMELEDVGQAEVEGRVLEGDGRTCLSPSLSAHSVCDAAWATAK